MEAFYHIIRVFRLTADFVSTPSKVKVDVSKITGVTCSNVTYLSRLITYFGDCDSIRSLLKTGDICYFIFVNYTKGSYFYPLYICEPFINIEAEKCFKYVPLNCPFASVVLSAVYDNSALTSFDECISFLRDCCPGAKIVPGQSYFPI